MSTKKSIPFEFFRPNEFMYFDIERIAAFEKEIGGVPLVKAMEDMENKMCAVGFILAACRIGLAHHYSNRPGVMAEELDKYLDRGGSLFDVEFLSSINRAFFASGLFGKKIADKAVRNELNVPDAEEGAEATDEKNAEAASE